MQICLIPVSTIYLGCVFEFFVSEDVGFRGGDAFANLLQITTGSPVHLSYFSGMKQRFPLTTFQYKHQHKPNFSPR